MSLRNRARTVVVAAVAAGFLAGCASIPVTGEVQQGRDEIPRGPDVGQIARGPVADADPDVIVNGFLLAAQSIPTSVTGINVAREFLTDQAADSWSPESRVVVTEGLPQPVPSEVDPSTDRVTVQASSTVVASLDEHGVFREEPVAVAQPLTFDLERVAGQWRIAQLDDGVIVPSPSFGSTFHVTTLYFPTTDGTSWVPDVRWFPQTTWRTNAVRELLAGPPEYLAGAASSVLPEGTRLASLSVTEGPDGRLEVELSDQISEAPGELRGLFAAQVRATLADGGGEPVVTLIDSNGPIVPQEVDPLEFPRTPGKAVVLQGGTLKDLKGRSLEPSELVVHLDGLDPTELAISPAGDAVVVRDGDGRLVRVTGKEPAMLLSGTKLVAPSIDRFGTVWTADVGGPIVVVTPGGDHHDLAAPWLDGREVVSVRVSPEGARVAVVSRADGATSVQVAGIQRDARGVPTGLTPTTLTVGASVREVDQAVWQEEAVLALLGHDDTGAAAVFFAGVGGLSNSVDGTPRRVGGINEPVWLSASVGSGDVLAINTDAELHLRQSTAVWPLVGTNVQLAAFAG